MTRGIRNNNPLNLRCSSSPWKGKVLINNDGKFEQFICMEYGFRAAILTIETYILKYGCNTIRTIISRWAPARVRKPAAKADTAPLNQQAAGTSALPNTTSCAGGPIWVKENDTENYIRYVCGKTGIGGNEPLSNHDPRIKDIVAAMAEMECGKGIKDYWDSLDKAFDAFEPKSVYTKERKRKYT